MIITFRIQSKSGDDVMTFDTEVKEQVDAAQRLFQEAIDNGQLVITGQKGSNNKLAALLFNQLQEEVVIMAPMCGG